jgi:predicted small lipoprotein YifL
VILIVKSPFALISGLTLLALLSGCGQPGPLYMPKPPTRAAAKATPPPAPAVATPAVPSTPAMGTGSNANNTEAIQH